MKLILRLIGLKMSILRVDAAIINPKTVKPNLYPCIAFPAYYIGISMCKEEYIDTLHRWSRICLYAIIVYFLVFGFKAEVGRAEAENMGVAYRILPHGVVLCDHTSNYRGKYGVQFNLVAGQSRHYFESRRMDLLIDMGEMSGAYMGLNPKEVWRVNPDGQVRDTWRKITHIFDMQELDFFRKYSELSASDGMELSYYEECKAEDAMLREKMPELPFSNDWIAQVTAPKLPDDSVLHLGILNTLRSWNFFELPKTISCYCNTGGFGIDGIVSTFIGSALAHPEKLHFCVVGDLAFFYDLNAIANHNVGNNIRILLINNGCGTEFKNYNHFAAQFGDDANEFMAAMGHYGQKSPSLVRHYATDLGFEYLSASDKEEYLNSVDRFILPELTDKPLLFEVFTDYQEESDALRLIKHIIDDGPSATDVAKKMAKGILGEKGVKTLKRIVKG